MEEGNLSDDEVNGVKRSLSSIKKPPTFKDRLSHLPVPKPFDGDYVEYTENTTIHGVKYLGEPRRPWPEKIFWITIFLCCFLCLGYFIREVVVKWQKCPVILVEDDKATPIYNIPFPAVTICPQIKLKYDKFSYESFISELFSKQETVLKDHSLLTKYEIAQQVCHNLIVKEIKAMKGMPPLKETIDASYINVLYELSPNPNETIDEAHYKTDFRALLSADDDEGSGDFPFENSDVRHHFSSVLTNEGVCFTFNTPKEILRYESIQKAYPYNDINSTSNKWDSENGYNIEGRSNFEFFPLFMYGAGKSFGLKLKLNSLVKDMDRLCQPTQIGFKIVLHAPSVYPTTYDDYILINYQSINNIEVTPKIIKTSENLRTYTPQRRQCYFSNERRLKYFAYYNKVNCKLECISNYTMETYKCVHYSLPMDPGAPICGAKPPADGVDYSDMYNFAQNIASLVNLLLEQDDTVNRLELECNCLPECNSIEYSYDIETEPIDYFAIYRKIQEVFNTTVELDQIDTEINIFIKDTEVFGKTRNQLYTFADLVSNFGGLMGLFMGASILSAVELIYFFAIRQICKSKGSGSGRRN